MDRNTLQVEKKPQKKALIGLRLSTIDIEYLSRIATSEKSTVQAVVRAIIKQFIEENRKLLK